MSKSDDLGEVYEYLIDLMSSQDRYSGESYFWNKSLLEEIELFLRTSTIEDDS